MEFMNEFPDDGACLEYLWRQRYSQDGEHAYCPRCEVPRTFKHYKTAQQRQSWTCLGCGLHLHPTAGTIFHKSSTSLQLWFYAMYLITSTKCGVSAKQLERELGVTYKTAWRMFNLIRNGLMADDSGGTLSGKVEADEAYFSRSKRLGRESHPGKSEGERTVFGMVERGGRVVVRHVHDAKAETLMPHVVEHITPESMVFTDEYPSYSGFA
jgi:transposase-like protein